MPLTKEAALRFKENNYCYKILDPACGSGVFLVMAYIRLIQWWRICNDYRRPTKEVLKEIMRKNIYGIDKDVNAVQLTYFSLCLSLCDLLSPKDIYPDNLHFDDFLVIKGIPKQIRIHHERTSEATIRDDSRLR